MDLDGDINSSTGKGMTQVHVDKDLKQFTRLDDMLNGEFIRLEKSYDHWMNVLLEKH